MLPFKPLCDVCKFSPATVFVTRIVHQNSNKQRLCSACARQQNASGASLHTDKPLIGDGSIPSSIAMDEVVAELYQQMKKSKADGTAPPSFKKPTSGFPMLNFAPDAKASNQNNFGAQNNGGEKEEEDNYSEADYEKEASADNDFGDADLADIFDDSAEAGVLPTAETGASASREIISARCPKCATTWDRLRQDGRAGCSQCYVAFDKKLAQVMEKMQRQPLHIGKLPRAALKRQRRLEHLRTKRDHRLEMLNERLKSAVAGEKYEDAAQLRDKIKMVSSTIVSND